eukprot:CAMPEP_0173409412 /NCGR_PEP_ID=MMETSP1356-20130122/72092_1 /TAXON_ID=77927 ORGANISM="Hemiselmis virescens, Strain PCC157" /NCGR_SAMPLE_ID=MMETSP1356 /ASSEMBLY_ACC=CAM_ASM_000847 /LENGTH=33 /DNA_ID= /DNA_START= /DNA_END= /DNA_ORIENTATION=
MTPPRGFVSHVLFAVHRVVELFAYMAMCLIDPV